MDVGFRRKQPNIHNRLIKEEAGYIGKFKCSLRPGDVQEMVWPVYEDKDFDPEQHGPYHMTPQEQLTNRKAVYREMVIGVEKTTEELIRDIFILNNVSKR